MYKIIFSEFHQKQTIVRLADNAAIPEDMNNSDYREYLAWLDQGNTPTQIQIPINPSDTRIAARIVASKTAVKNIPSWVTWSEEQALAWIQTNIGDPLATPIPPNPMTAAQIRATLVSIVALLNTIRTMLIAMTKLIIALRDKNWPEIPEE